MCCFLTNTLVSDQEDTALTNVSLPAALNHFTHSRTRTHALNGKYRGARWLNHSRVCNNCTCRWDSDFLERLINIPSWNRVLTFFFSLLYLIRVVSLEYGESWFMVLYLTVWLKPDAIWSFCEPQYVGFDPTKMLTHSQCFLWYWSTNTLQ